MAFCKKCGEKLEDGAKFCHKCGGAVSDNVEYIVAEQVSDENDVEKNRFMAALAYFGIFVVVPVIAAKESKFAKFHANQGLILLIFEAMLVIAGEIFSIIPFMGLLASFVYNIGGLCAFILLIIGLVNVVKGEEKRLPIIGEFDVLK